MTRSQPRRQILSIVVLISGKGSNLQSIIDAIESGCLEAKICAVISNEPGAYGLIRAAAHGIENRVIDHRSFASRDAFDLALHRSIQSFVPDFIVLAGFMRILGSAFIQSNVDKILNIHPSLLPDYKGLDTHKRVIENNETKHGVSIHLVTAELDGGPLILQGRFPVTADDTITELKRRGRQLEHRMYPLVLQWLSVGKLHIEQNSIVYEHQLLQEPVEFENI
ncbi:MAG: phosphoribosylglycinamide formyltransferase [Proteobacteria bacterium]|nr:phosphoribosylglycinamide formyltransferase [Pseudomonadota bacterium]